MDLILSINTIQNTKELSNLRSFLVTFSFTSLLYKILSFIIVNKLLDRSPNGVYTLFFTY